MLTFLAMGLEFLPSQRLSGDHFVDATFQHQEIFAKPRVGTGVPMCPFTF
jgi:hypothetical protein